ncbi:MAG: glycosyltransferase [Candidatus Falkowbacteria bacterium]
MKIALANNLYYPYNRGGAETVVKNMIAELKAQGHDVFLISCRPKADLNPTSNGIKTYYFPSDYSRLAEIPPYLRIFWHAKNIFSFKRSAEIKKILVVEKPELIITHNLMGLGFRLPCVIKKLKIHHEHYLHDIQLLYPTGLMMLGKEKIVDSWPAKFYQLFTRAFFESPAKVISPSLWLLGQHRLRGFFHDSETEIKNFNSGEKVAKETTKQDEQKSKQNFLFVGQIEFHKGILLLIKAFLSALETKADLRLTIIGDGSLMSEAKQLAKNDPKIDFRGRLEAPELKKIMESSDCLVIPSLCYENTPMTIHEAHNSKLRVLAANIGGIPEIINSNDKLFRPGDILDLEKHILKK